MTKRIWTMLLAAAMVLAMFAGCGSGADSGANSSAAPAAPSAVETAEAAAEETQTPETPAAAEETSAEEEAPAETPEVIEVAPEEGLAPTEFPIADGITLQVFNALMPGSIVEDLADVVSWQEIMEKSGINFEFTNIAIQAAAENFNLKVASGDYGDVISGVVQYYTPGLTGALDEEIIVDLYNYEENIPHFLSVLENDDDVMMQMVTDNGELSGFHAIKLQEDPSQNGLMVRKDFLDGMGYDYAGLQEFGKFTYDDLNDMLYALKAEYGLNNTLWMSSGLSLMKHLENGLETCAYTERSRVPVYTVDGVVQFGPVTDGFKDYITMLHQWYVDGIISTDFATGTSEPDTGDVLNGNVAMWYSAGQVIYQYMEAAEGDFDLVYLPDPVSPDHQYVNTFYPRVQTTGFSIASTCTDPAAAATFFDYFYSDEGMVYSRYGIEDLTFTYDGDGNPQYTDLITDNPDGLTSTQAITKYLMQICVTNWWDTSFSQADYQMSAYEIWTDLDENSTAMAFPSCELNSEETEFVGQTYTDMMTYYNTASAQFVTGDLDIERDWDAYLDTMYSFNLEEIIACYQACYDRYQERGIIVASK